MCCFCTKALATALLCVFPSSDVNQEPNLDVTYKSDASYCLESCILDAL